MGWPWRIFDNDGDLDLITNNLNEARRSKNNSQEPRIQVRLFGEVGSRVRLRRASGENRARKVFWWRLSQRRQRRTGVRSRVAWRRGFA